MSRSNDRLGEHASPPSARRRGSLATRLALGSVLLVLCVTSITVIELTQREWRRLVDSRRTAADMVANLFAGTMAAALDGGDVEAVRTDLNGLRSNAIIVYAGVFTADNPNPLAEYRNGRGDGGPADAARDEGEIQVQSGVHSSTGARLGSVVIRVSLAQEVHAFRRTRARLIGFGALFAAGLASLLVMIMRRVLVAPLGRLEAAAVKLAGGHRVIVPADRDDELGSLSQAFNAMAGNIDDRERRIAAQNRRLQALFDNLGQAIIVFGPDRLLTEERSRSAERWLDARPGNSVLDILYPEDEALDVERQAFDAWLDVAFAAPASKFRELSGLAPRELTRLVAGSSMHFDLSFRLAEQLGSARQLMLLATDVTEQRRLEHSVSEKEREHERELSALRRLSTGGGQLLGSFLDVARRRLFTCRELLTSMTTRGGDVVAQNDAAVDRGAIDGMLQHLHTIRAEARCFDLAQLDADVGSLESDLGRIRADAYVLREADHDNLGRSLDYVSRRLDEAERSFVEQSPLGSNALDQISVRRLRLVAVAEAVRDRSDRLARLIEELTARPLVESFALLPEAVARWAEQGGKKVRLALEPNGSEIPFALSRVLGGVLSHLLRNAIAHAIEPEAERLARGKPAVGNVRIWAQPGPSGTIIRIEDDGRGFDIAERGARTVAGTSGAGPAVTAALESGVSNCSGKDVLSSVGVGLGAVRNELVCVGYRIELVSTSILGSRIEMSPAPRRESRVQERHVG